MNLKIIQNGITVIDYKGLHSLSMSETNIDICISAAGTFPCDDDELDKGTTQTFDIIDKNIPIDSITIEVGKELLK